jgi:hypothetical protein
MTPEQTFRRLVAVFAESWNAPDALDRGLAKLEAEADEAALDRAYERFTVCQCRFKFPQMCRSKIPQPSGLR